jgi:hypothetical protein
VFYKEQEHLRRSQELGIKNHTVPALPRDPQYEEHQCVPHRRRKGDEWRSEGKAAIFQVGRRGGSWGPNVSKPWRQAAALEEEMKEILVFVAEGAAGGRQHTMSMEESTRPGIPMPRNPEEDPDLERREVCPVAVGEREDNPGRDHRAVCSGRGEGGSPRQQAGVRFIGEGSVLKRGRQRVELGLCDH